MTTPTESPAPDPSPVTAGDLSERYGRPRRAPRRPLVIGALVVIALLTLAFTYWVTVIDRAKVTFQDYGYEVRSASQVVITFDIQLHAGADRAVCTVHALNSLGTEVGLQDVEVEGGENGRARMTVTLPTSEAATTGLVRDCTAG